MITTTVRCHSSFERKIEHKPICRSTMQQVVTPLWCDLGCCSRTVVVIKAAENPRLYNRGPRVHARQTTSGRWPKHTRREFHPAEAYEQSQTARQRSRRESTNGTPRRDAVRRCGATASLRPCGAHLTHNRAHTCPTSAPRDCAQMRPTIAPHAEPARGPNARCRSRGCATVPNAACHCPSPHRRPAAAARPLPRCSGWAAVTRPGRYNNIIYSGSGSMYKIVIYSTGGRWRDPRALPRIRQTAAARVASSIYNIVIQ